MTDVAVTGSGVTDLAVIGLGGIGSGAAYWASRFGASVTGYEQFDFGHERGASHDHSRIIRYSYHTPYYVELSKLAYSTWSELEAESGEHLVVRCGGIDLFPAGGAIDPADYRTSLEAGGVPYEWLDAASIRQRWPQFRVADDVHGLYQPDGGIAAAAKGVAAHQAMAVRRGAALRARSAVESVREARGAVEIVVDGKTERARAAVIAADAWTNALLPQPLPLTVLREQVTYFDAPEPEAFAVGAFPVWIWMDEPSFYGFPTFGEGATKVAQDCGGHATTASSRTFEPDRDELGRVTDAARRLFGDTIGPATTTKTCLYTLTPDRDFVLDRVPGTENIWVVLGAAHAYKYASILGQLAARCALEGTCEAWFDRTPFRVDRPALTDPAFAANWMV